jgi:hypothetical protein
MIISETISRSHEKPVIDMIGSLNRRIAKTADDVSNSTRPNALSDKDETDALSFCVLALPTSLWILMGIPRSVPVETIVEKAIMLDK